MVGALVMVPAPALGGPVPGPAATGDVPADAPVGTGFTRTGDAEPTAVVHLALGLTRASSELRTRAVAVSDPGSSSYGDHLGLDEVGALAGTTATGPAVVAALAAAGVPAWVDPTGLFVHATPTVERATAVFGTSWGRYTGPGLALDIPYLAADVAPTLPAGLEGLVAELTGFVQALPYTSFPTAATGGVSGPSALPPAPVNDGTAQGCPDALATGAYTAEQLVEAYGVDRSASADAHVAVLIDGDGFVPQTFDTYAACFGITLPAPTVHLVPPQDAPITSSAGELDGDAQTVVGTAPDIGRLDLVQGVFGVYQWPLLFAAGLDPSVVGAPPDAVTMSDGVAETTVPAATVSLLEDVFVTHALVGTTVAIPAGDSGSQSFPDLPGLPQSYPSSSPWVVSIGGTNLTLDAANRPVEELVWNDNRYQGYDTQATGGGPSEVFPAPPWSPAPTRRLPDLSLFAAAYPGVTQVLDLGSGVGWYGASGTSFASPLFATAIALVDARLREAGRPRLGLVTPWLYGAAEQLWDDGALHDITVGSNDVSDVGCCRATVGYDTASGLGAPRFAELLEAALALGPPPSPAASVDVVGPAFTG